MFRCVVMACVLGVAKLSSAQTPAPALEQASAVPGRVANADVIAMVKAQLSEDVVVASIAQSAAIEFDLAPLALIALKEAGVSDIVIRAMQARQAQAGAELPGTPTAGVSTVEPCRVFITEEDPPSRFYTMVRKEVQDGKKWYGKHDEDLMYKLAKQAQKVGADAIIAFHEWRAPSGWSWAAAKAGGMAVKWTDEGKAAVPSMKGQCWSPAGKNDRGPQR